MCWQWRGTTKKGTSMKTSGKPKIFRQIWNAQNVHFNMDTTQSELSVINKQVRQAYTLKHFMFESDHLLFATSLHDHLQSSHKSKTHWFQSVCIAVHDFKVVHKRSPTQQILVDFSHRL
uniref:Uncharacterized protein n=1 Tax=Ditylum brightwellii TaxID=49249 RepID=A0A7S4VYD9_9STRA|mmetsp:Transcript_23359/g.34972  ORF Transcript_23359/g.34972 Transcript_23359/m.34972 type:complete len:119 (-) Transcript_23359:443-799(-)